MDFKFGRNIHRVHEKKSPLKFRRKGSVGISMDWLPLLSQEPAKLQTSTFVCIASLGRKAH